MDKGKRSLVEKWNELFEANREVKVGVVTYKQWEFDDFIRNIYPKEKRDKYFRIKDFDSVRGRYFSEVICLGMFYKVPHLEEIMHVALGRVRR